MHTPREAASAIRILIVDDHVAIRVGLTSMLEAQDGFKIIGSAASGVEALSILETRAADIVLLDLRMQVMDGIGLMQEIARRHRGLRPIVLTSYETDEDVYKAVSAGAQGYVLKDASEQELVEAIHSVYGGASYFPRQVAARLAERMQRSDLSRREMEVLGMLAKGWTNKQIANELDISSYTVRSHVAKITAKLEVADRTEAVTLAIKRGMIQVS